MRNLSLLMVVIFGMFLSSCTGEEPVQNLPQEGLEATTTEEETQMCEFVLSAEEQAAVGSMNAFGVDFLKAVVEESHDKKENVVVSPLSAQILLSMLANTSDETTGAEIADVLGYSDVNVLNDLSRKYILGLPAVSEKVKMKLNNSLWYHSGLELNPLFGEILDHYYNAPSNPRDFGSPDAVVDEINKWCADNTENLIDRVLEELPPGSVFVLANAMYFKANWLTPFNEEVNERKTFHGLHQDAMVEMMHTSLGMQYAESSDFKAVNFPFEDGFSTWFVLPEDNVAIDDFIEGFDLKHLNDHSDVAIVDFSLPKFKYATELIPLDDALRYLGINSVFESCKFTMFLNPIKDGNAEVKQKCTIEFNEDGASAAAVTLAIGEGALGPGEKPEIEKKIVNLDRPFLFFIMENHSGACLMAGKIVNL